MPLNITITLSDEDLQKFQESIDKGKLAIESPDIAAEVEESAAALITQAQELELPQFISDRLLKLEVLLNMIRDEEWKLTQEERNSIRSALY